METSQKFMERRFRLATAYDNNWTCNPISENYELLHRCSKEQSLPLPENIPQRKYGQ